MARFEFSDGKSNKFWEIELQGSAFTVRYGRIGTDGQTQTKSFTSDDLARKEHDKLVAEKLKKGYTAAGGSAVSSASASAPPPSEKSTTPLPAAPLRKDLYVYNEATGFVITSKRIGQKGWDSLGTEWEKGVRNGDLIPIELIQDDPFTIRVVVGGELEAAEAEEWVGRLDWKLRVPDGNLVVCGGSEYIEEKEAAEYMSDYLRHMKVPRGDYRASVYMYFGGVNGRACLSAARGGDEPEPLGEWFRNTRPGQPFPAWLHNDCVMDPAEDPGHEKEWKNAKQVEDPVENYIEFLLHLTPLKDGDTVTMPELGNGWFSTPTQCREPERIPLGIPARDAEGLPKKPDPNAVYPIDVFKHTQNFKRTPLKGEPVEVPVAHLERVFRIAWFCHVWAMPQIRVTLPKGASLAEIAARFEHVLFERSGDTLNFTFEASGSQSGSIKQVAAVAERLKELPDGSIIELDTAYLDEEMLKVERPLALHRYRGTVRGGMLKIEETFPTVDAGKLNAALAMSAQVEKGGPIDAGSEAVFKAAFASLKTHPFFSDNPAVKEGATSIRMRKSEPVMLNFVAAEVFTRTFADVWPVFTFEEDDEEDEDEEEEESPPSKGPPKPPRGELILKGEKRRAIYASDAKKLDKDAQKRIEEAERDLLPLGFKWVGDLVCMPMDQLVIRGYAQDDGTAWAALMVAQFGRGFFEFVSRFEDGAGLATTRNSMVRDELYRDAYKSSRPTGSVQDMWAAHQRRGAFLAEYHGPLVKVTPTVKQLADDIENSIKRQETLAIVRPKTLVLRGGDERKYYAYDARTIDPTAPQAVADADALMKKLGFEPVGDVIGTFFTAHVFRGYTRPGGDTWAKFQVEASSVPAAMGTWEFATVFENGACLVSARSSMSKDEPKRKIYRILDFKSPPEKLLEQHEKRKEELTKKHGAPVKVSPDMKGLAREVEAAYERLLG